MVNASQLTRADRWPWLSSSRYARCTAVGDGAKFVTRHAYPYLRAPISSRRTGPPSCLAKVRLAVETIEEEQQGDESADQDACGSKARASLTALLDLCMRDQSGENGEYRYDWHKGDH